MFQSHCAPDPDDTTPAKLPVARLRAALQAVGLPTSGTKAELVARLEEHQVAPATPPAKVGMTVPQLKAALKGLGLPTSGTKAVLMARLAGVAKDEEGLPTPGTGHLGVVASAREAAEEKLRAGEGRHVEHVALHTPDSDALAGGASKRKRGTHAV